MWLRFTQLRLRKPVLKAMEEVQAEIHNVFVGVGLRVRCPLLQGGREGYERLRVTRKEGGRGSRREGSRQHKCGRARDSPDHAGDQVMTEDTPITHLVWRDSLAHFSSMSGKASSLCGDITNIVQVEHALRDELKDFPPFWKCLEYRGRAS